MKLIYALSAIALTTLALMTGCGSDDEEPKPGQPGSVSNPASPVPPPGTSTVPVGCYNTGVYNNAYPNNGCQRCPLGYIETNGVCSLNNVAGAGNCPAGSTWTGYSCTPSSFNGCFANTAWSYQFGGCVTPNLIQTYPTYYYPPVYLGGLWVYRWYGGSTGTAQAGCYFNGFGFYCGFQI